ncbi:MAG TPA: tripartite tricarboxylate transporter TctB family protein [Candidatus Sulfotelmatobacter sp.]|nr:tripartite tricarboxylate transporter TctB family protein [Candidatus Sulfotelmatobacter sp.]
MTGGGVPSLVRRGDLAAGALFAGLGMGVCVRAMTLTIGSAHDPQPGFFPLIGGILLVALATLLIVQAFGGGRGAPGEAAGDSLRPPAVLVTGLAIYAALLEWAGYPVMTALMALLALRVLGTRWAPGIVVSVALAVGSYLLFVKLGVPLPLGQIFGG